MTDGYAMFSTISNSILTLAYPQACEICEKSVEKYADGKACEDCWNETRIFAGNEMLCEKCGAFLSEKASEFKNFCKRCNEHFYDRAIACGIYEKAFLRSIINLKTTPFVPPKISKLLLETFQNSGFSDITKIIPVPLSIEKFAARTFNQAAILAADLAQKTGLLSDEISLVRTIHTAKHRRGMDRKGRAMSVHNAFKVQRPKLIKDQIILLVDDVFTTGATVSNCAKALKKSDAKKVYVLTIARAV
jgi:competence protein ComFC